MHLAPKLAAHSVRSVHLGRKFSPSKSETVSPANALYQKFREMGMAANISHDFVNRVHPPKFNSGKFDTMTKKQKPLLASAFMRPGNVLRGRPGGVKRGI